MHDVLVITTQSVVQHRAKLGAPTKLGASPHTLRTPGDIMDHLLGSRRVFGKGLVGERLAKGFAFGGTEVVRCAVPRYYVFDALEKI